MSTSALREALEAVSVNSDAVTHALAGLDAQGRQAVLRSLGKRHLCRLYDWADPSCTLEALVPRSVGSLAPVAYDGLNSLPMFRTFQKIFCWPTSTPDALHGTATAAQDVLLRSTIKTQDRLWGYNQNPAVVMPFVGPGYFVVTESAEGRGLIIDYDVIPTERPLAWPELSSNRHLLGRIVYAGHHDILRRVSEHVFVGQMFRGTRSRNTWFVLSRNDAPALVVTSE